MRRDDTVELVDNEQIDTEPHFDSMVDIEIEDDIDKAFNEYKTDNVKEENNGGFFLTTILVFFIIFFSSVTFYYENFNISVPFFILFLVFIILSIITSITVYIVKNLKDTFFPFLTVFTYFGFVEFFNIVLLHSFLLCSLLIWTVIGGILIGFRFSKNPQNATKSVIVATIS